MIPAKFEGIYPEIDDPKEGGCWDGSVGRERSIGCMEAFADVIGPRFREETRILDYGCGSGRFANFLSTRLTQFQYWGLEPHEYVDHFERYWWKLREDPRVELGTIEGPMLDEALGECDVVLLLSVLTHLPLACWGAVLTKFSSAVERGAAVVFSVFLTRRSAEGKSKFPGYHKWVATTTDAIDALARELDWGIEKCGTWHDSGKLTHSIFVGSRRRLT